MRDKVDSDDEELLDYFSDGSGTEEMESAEEPVKMDESFQVPFSAKSGKNEKCTPIGQTCTYAVPRPFRQVLLCWHGSQCPWHPRGRCLFRRCEAENDVKRPATSEVEEIRAELKALWAVLRKFEAPSM